MGSEDIFVCAFEGKNVNSIISRVLYKQTQNAEALFLSSSTGLDHGDFSHKQKRMMARLR